MKICPPSTKRFNAAMKNTAVLRAVHKRSGTRRVKTESRGVYRNTSSDEVCSVTPQMRVFQRPVSVASPDPAAYPSAPQARRP